MMVAGGTVTIDSSIVANNSADTSPDLNGSVTAGASLIENTAGASITAGTGANITAQDPLLNGLANNGGPTQTMALGMNSPARDNGTNLLSFTSDQRGQPRNDGGGVDMGAYEYSVVAISPPVITDPGSAMTAGGTSYDIKGSAQMNALVRIYSDANNDGFINGPDVVVSQWQLSGGATSFTITTPLVAGVGNNFLATADDGAGHESTPTDVPTITQGATGGGGGTSGGGGGGGGGGCAAQTGNGWQWLAGLGMLFFGLFRGFIRRRA
jgi:hypothetical protein